MPYNPMDMFSIGQKIGKSKRSTFGMTSDDLMSNFKTQQEAGAKLMPILAGAAYKQQLENESPSTKSTIALNEAKTNLANVKSNESTGNIGRDIFLVNRRTGTISKAGDKSMAPVDPSTVSKSSRIMGVDIPPASATSMFTSAEASTKQIDNLIGMLESAKTGGPNSPNKFVGGLTGMARPLQGLANKSTQDYGLIRQDFSDRLLRLRSGAQINEQEYQRLMSMLPQWWRNSDTDIEQLKRFKNEYESLMSRLSGSGLSNGGGFEDSIPNQNEENDDPAGLFQ